MKSLLEVLNTMRDVFWTAGGSTGPQGGKEKQRKQKCNPLKHNGLFKMRTEFHNVKALQSQGRVDEQ